MFDITKEAITPYIHEFLEVYKKRPILDNSGGMKAPHCFWTWFLLKQINPSFVIESGIWYGMSTWLIEQACPDATIYSIDPNLAQRKYISTRARYSTADFKTHNGPVILGKDGCKNTVAFIDDHQNNFERLSYGSECGIGHMIFEDNYPTNHGDVLSIKKIMSNNYHILDVNGSRTTHSIPNVYKQIVNVMCEYFECPPPFLDSLVTRWGDKFEDHNCKSPIFTEVLDASMTIFKEDQLNYTFMGYARMNV
jgi:hypothetical protein